MEHQFAGAHGGGSRRWKAWASRPDDRYAGPTPVHRRRGKSRYIEAADHATNPAAFSRGSHRDDPSFRATTRTWRRERLSLRSCGPPPTRFYPHGTAANRLAQDLAIPPKRCRSTGFRPARPLPIRMPRRLRPAAGDRDAVAVVEIAQRRLGFPSGEPAGGRARGICAPRFRTGRRLVQAARAEQLDDARPRPAALHECDHAVPESAAVGAGAKPDGTLPHDVERARGLGRPAGHPARGRRGERALTSGSTASRWAWRRTRGCRPEF